MSAIDIGLEEMSGGTITIPIAIVIAKKVVYKKP